MERRDHISALDNIEVLQVAQQKSDFPEHYHDTFCISFIKAGMEAIRMGDNVLFTEKGHISINNPYEIHANPLVDTSLPNAFTTLYLSPDLVDHFLQLKNVNFCHQQSIDTHQSELFEQIVQAVRIDDIAQLEQALPEFLGRFDMRSQTALDDIKSANLKWTELMTLIDNKLEEKVSLELLARFMNMKLFNESFFWRK